MPINVLLRSLQQCVSNRMKHGTASRRREVTNYRHTMPTATVHHKCIYCQKKLFTKTGNVHKT